MLGGTPSDKENTRLTSGNSESGKNEVEKVHHVDVVLRENEKWKRMAFEEVCTEERKEDGAGEDGAHQGDFIRMHCA